MLTAMVHSNPEVPVGHPASLFTAHRWHSLTTLVKVSMCLVVNTTILLSLMALT